MDFTALIQTPMGLVIVVFGGIVAVMIFARLAFFGMFLLAIPVSAAVAGLRSGIPRFAFRDRTDKAPEMEKIGTAVFQRIETPAEEEKGESAATNASSLEGYRMPRNLLYHPKHIWMKQEPYGKLRIGFNDFAQRLLGSIQQIDFLTFSVQKLAKNGWQIAQSFLRGWDLHCNGRTVRINSPIQGRIVDINDQIGQEPSNIAKDPYGEGWLCTIMPGKNPMYDAISETQIDRWIGDEVNRLRQYSDDRGIAVHQDGGELVMNPAESLSESEWKQLVMDFISE